MSQYGIYLKTRPKSKWQLVSVAVTAEGAAFDMKEALDQAKAEGNEQAEVKTQFFDTSFFIPHYLNEVKETKPMYN